MDGFWSKEATFSRWLAIIVLIGCALLAAGALISMAFDFLIMYWWRPASIRRIMRKQGVTGPIPRFIIGNYSEMARMREEGVQHDMTHLTHDIVDRLMPDYVEWSKRYGKRFVFWWGTEPRLTVSEPELIRELLSSKCVQCYGKSYLQQKGVIDFIGRGLVMANGEEWANQRRIVAPAFHFENLKAQAKDMVKCTAQMLVEWEELVKQSKVIEVSEQMSRLAGDIIARTEFGSSYEKGKKIFVQLRALQKLSTQACRKNWLPGNRLLPTSLNRQIRKLKQDVETALLDIIRTRKDSIRSGRSTSFGHDLLGLMLSKMEKGSPGKIKFTTQHLIDECKTFFFTGHDTTAILLTWTLMLLASNPSWQERVRTEIMEICGSAAPNPDILCRFKLLGMVLNESLRLYTPASLLARQAFSDTQLGDLTIPKGLSVWIPILAIHHDKKIWGPDANEFNPERFSDGGLKACQSPMGFLPFALGPRNCVGQNFAIMEAKIALAMIISRFRFSLSPTYRHAPIFVLTLKPKHGVPLIFESLNAAEYLT